MIISAPHKTIICKCGTVFQPIVGYSGIIQSRFCQKCRVDAEMEKRKAKVKQLHDRKINSLKTPVLPSENKLKRIKKAGANNKNNLDKEFSLFIRQRDAKDGIIYCISCGKPVSWKKSDCGHYINRAVMATRYDEINCNAQCRHCNRFREGNMSGYRKGLIKKWGESQVDLLEIKKFNASHISQVELEFLIVEYKAKNKLYETN